MARKKEENILVVLSGYVSKRNVAVVMTYLYIITFLVLIASQLRLTSDHSLTGDNDGFIKRSLNSYERSTNTYESLRKLTLSKDNKDTDKMTGKGQKSDVKAANKNNTMGEQRQSKHNDADDVIKLIKNQTVNKDDAGNARIEKKVKAQQSNNKMGSDNMKTSVVRQVRSKNPYLQVVPNLDITNSPEPRELAWQKIMANGTFLIFSAVMDYIYGEPYVKALAINGNFFLPKFYCELTYNQTGVVTTIGKTWILPDHHEKTYKTLFLFCPLPNDEIPVYLSIIPIYDPVRLHRLPVLYHPHEKRNFTICVSPLFFNRSIEYELVQWFELNMLLGVDLFIVYSFSNHPRTSEILRHYAADGLVQEIPWVLPDYTDLHYYGQNAAVNDCMMRNYKISRYMVNIDIDEVIVPRKAVTTLNELMSNLPKNFCEYSFRSTFMADESKDVFEGKQKARELNLHFMLRISRRAYIFDKAVRSKYIVNTTCIDTVGIHYCWKYKNGTIETERYYVPPREALMFHFRSERVMKEGKEIEEKAVYKYHKPLIENAKARWEKINKERAEAKKKANQDTKRNQKKNTK